MAALAGPAGDRAQQGGLPLWGSQAGRGQPAARVVVGGLSAAPLCGGGPGSGRDVQPRGRCDGRAARSAGPARGSRFVKICLWAVAVPDGLIRCCGGLAYC